MYETIEPTTKLRWRVDRFGDKTLQQLVIIKEWLSPNRYTIKGEEWKDIEQVRK